MKAINTRPFSPCSVAILYGNKLYRAQQMAETLDRLDLRLPTTAKQLLQQAAAITGNTLSALVLKCGTGSGA